VKAPPSSDRTTPSAPIEDYAIIGDCHTAALVSRAGSIDWLCLPRFDSGACFAALLGSPDNGRWRIAPAGGTREVRRSYRGRSLVLETEHHTEDGVVAVIDFMPVRDDVADVVRIVEGRGGRVPMRMELVMRFDHGAVIPWVQRAERGIDAVAGPDRLSLRCDVPTRGEQFRTVSEFAVSAGERVRFDLTWSPSYGPVARELDEMAAVAATQSWWEEWIQPCQHAGPWHDAVVRSLVTLKALTYAPTGGIVAAATTSLPEQLGGERNWDYRYCWLRDATLTLYALLESGYTKEAEAWREWLIRAVAGHPSQFQIMYGVGGERRLTEVELPWLPGYAGSRPVRIGNAAYDQLQLDVYGEVIDCLYQCRKVGLAPYDLGWKLVSSMLDHLEGAWKEPDEGIWEVRGPRRHFTHSKVMAWVGVDRAVQSIERFGREGPLDRWRALRATIHEEVCRDGWNPKVGAFTQSYGDDALDASLLLIPTVGFLPATDPRMVSTVEAIQRQLTVDGFVLRYPTRTAVDGLEPGEGAFLACSFWLADNLALQGRGDEARALFERLLAIRNDVGLLAEEYDPRARRQLGNFPQAFSHVSLVNSARNLGASGGPAQHRSS
jgi:GH15 family glucan-1,4-alpha-glucosidase